jgi:hypothetical protein
MTAIEDRVLPDNDPPGGRDEAKLLGSGIDQGDPNDAEETTFLEWEEPDSADVLEQLIVATYEFYDARGRERAAAEQNLRGWVAQHRWPERETLKLNRRRLRDAYWPDATDTAD